jgi:SNF2 family DNA or RNA helicase
MTTTKAGGKLTLRDLLSHLSFTQACKLLGQHGKQFISDGAKLDLNSEEQLYFGGDLVRVTYPGAGDVPEAIATLTLKSDQKDRLQWNCTCCTGPCEHVGGLLSLVLENKTSLGLAAAPPERVPVESLSEGELVKLALAEREERAKKERMKIKAASHDTPWTDYTVTSGLSGKSYRVSMRGLAAGESYCSCPDFRTNTLGTCKHVIKVAAHVKKKFSTPQLKKKYVRKRLAIHLRYDGDTHLRLLVPNRVSDEVEAIIRPLRDKPIADVLDLLRRIKRLQALDVPCPIYPDAEEFIQQQLHGERIAAEMAEIRRDPARHPWRTSLLKIPLLPYQMDGVAFAVGAGRAVLADDMGLGKTIQGVGVAEMLAREAGIRRVLVVCPASLKSQWKKEIHRFCDRDAQLISGPVAERARQYGNDCFFTICNYEQVLKDILSIEQTPWDLIILDEGQRIKNWEAKTTRVIKGLRSRFALVLSGTPLENRLDELFSVVSFIDDRRLGPGFRFFNRHRMVDDKGKILGYKHLDELRQRLAPVLLRRTRESVKLELPERSTELVRIPPTAEQKEIHDAHMRTVGTILRKKFLTEMDLMRLRMALMMCRMAANSTFLVTKENPAYSTKLERLAELFDDLQDEDDRKVVLFSEWTTMLDLIEPLLNKRKLRFVRLDGSVPQKKRQELVHEFQTNPDCRYFITTNAGSVGLNLQAANTVINVDLPWNPAVLEQRISRAHRMGQTQSVQVFVLVTEQTLEESLLATLSSKKDLALAALDPESDVDEVTMTSSTEQLKSRLEVLLGAKPAAPLDVSKKEDVSKTDGEKTAAQESERRERVAAAGGELLGAVFKFLGELVEGQARPAPPEPVVSQLRDRLGQCVTPDANGKPQLTITLPDSAALDGLAKTLAGLLVSG